MLYMYELFGNHTRWTGERLDLGANIYEGILTDSSNHEIPFQNSAEWQIKSCFPINASHVINEKVVETCKRPLSANA